MKSWLLGSDRQMALRHALILLTAYGSLAASMAAVPLAVFDGSDLQTDWSCLLDPVMGGALASRLIGCNAELVMLHIFLCSDLALVTGSESDLQVARPGMDTSTKPANYWCSRAMWSMCPRSKLPASSPFKVNLASTQMPRQLSEGVSSSLCDRAHQSTQAGRYWATAVSRCQHQMIRLFPHR